MLCYVKILNLLLQILVQKMALLVAKVNSYTEDGTISG